MKCTTPRISLQGYYRSPSEAGRVKSYLQLVTQTNVISAQRVFNSILCPSASSPSAAATAIPLRSFSHTHAGPRGSISYHQLSAIDRPDCRTWCHQPAGRYNVSPASTRMIIGCDVSGRDPGRSGCNIDDQRTGGFVESEGFRSRGEPSDSRSYAA